MSPDSERVGGCRCGDDPFTRNGYGKLTIRIERSAGMARSFCHVE